MSELYKKNFKRLVKQDGADTSEINQRLDSITLFQKAGSDITKIQKDYSNKDKSKFELLFFNEKSQEVESISLDDLKKLLEKNSYILFNRNIY